MTDRTPHPEAVQGAFSPVDVITCAQSGALLGYRFGGARPGPDVCVAGDAALIDALCDRLTRLPTLPWMRGRLYLVGIDAAHGMDTPALDACLDGMEMDVSILLPHARGMANWQCSVERAYWTTLRLCTRFGLIQGRGVQP